MEGLAESIADPGERIGEDLCNGMNFFKLARGSKGGLQVLCLGCHSDDIEIGCGGSVLRLAQEEQGCEFHWFVFSADGARAEEARRAAELFAGKAPRRVVLKTFRDGFMPFEGAAIKQVFENEVKPLCPDVIFTHYGGDAHQDHRLISELTWNTFRDHLILEYEIPKFDGDLGRPSFFVTLDSDVCRKKINYLMEVFASQRSKRWFQQDTFLSLMRLRGMECNASSGYAEAFYCRKVVI